MSNWIPDMKCSEPGCAQPATAHVAVVSQRKLLEERYFCDPHGKECVVRSLRTLPLGNSVSHSVPGAVCCDVCLILTRPYAIGEQQYVHLNEVAGPRWLSLYCGPIEAAVMLSSLKTPSPPRPFMHDVMANITRALGGTIKHVIIHDFVPDGGFYVAQLAITGPSGLLSVDARPSDVISLAIRSGAPIFVSEQLVRDE